MELTSTQKAWIKERETKFKNTNIGFTKEELLYIFELQGHIQDRTVRPTSCGRCIKTAIQLIWKEYQS